MTAKDVQRLDRLRDEVHDLRERLRELQDASVVSATIYSQASGGGGTGDPVSRTATLLVDLEDKIIHGILEMVEIIDSIPNERSRRIFMRRYINHCSWSEIADEFGYKDPNYAARHVRRVKKAGF